MGTTVVACLVVDQMRAVIGHAGDSRAYLLRDGRLTTLTRDHTGAPHMLTRNLGREYGVLPDVLELAPKPGDRLLLCSDGLYGGAPMAAIRRVLGSSATPERVAHQLVARVLKGDASDNVSAVVIAVDRAATPRRSPRAQTRRSHPSEPRENAPLTRPRLGTRAAGSSAHGDHVVAVHLLDVIEDRLLRLGEEARHERIPLRWSEALEVVGRRIDGPAPQGQ